MIFSQGYKISKAYLLTQMPLPGTVSDFLHILYDSSEHQPNAIIMLNEISDDDPVSCSLKCALN